MNRREALKHSSLILGYTLSASALSQVWSGCTSKPSSDWKPSFFTKEQFATISEIAERILPTTDIPGAKDLNIDQFVDLMIKNTFPEKDQLSLVTELERFEQECQEAMGDRFAELAAPDQESFLLEKEKESNTVNHTIWGETVGNQKPLPFYRKIKSMILLGYFTSEKVGENILTYEPVPGSQAGCIPLSEVGNAYSL